MYSQVTKNINLIAKGLRKHNNDIVAFCHPGFHASDIADRLKGKICINEKIAYEAAWGCSQNGFPAIVTFKNVGLNDAADPFLNSHLTGSGKGGLVVILLEDLLANGSQSSQDSRFISKINGGLWLEPIDIESLINYSEHALGISRRFDLPVVIRITNAMLESEVKTFGNKILFSTKDYNRQKSPVYKTLSVVHPVNARSQLEILNLKNKDIQAFIDKKYKPLSRSKFDTIIFGPAYSAIFTPNTINISTIPMPTLNNFSKSITLWDTGRYFLKNCISENLCQLKMKTHNLNTECIGAGDYIFCDKYLHFFTQLKALGYTLVGDLGEYTMDRERLVDKCLCFGSSPAVGCGFLYANKDSKVVCITGDGAFFHSGKNSIPQALKDKLNLKIILIDNGGSMGTGGQVIPGDIPCGIEVYNTDKSKLADFNIRLFLERKKSGILIVKENK